MRWRLAVALVHAGLLVLAIGARISAVLLAVAARLAGGMEELRAGLELAAAVRGRPRDYDPDDDVLAPPPSDFERRNW